VTKRALVLSGGGAKGIFEVGCLRALLQKDNALDFDFFVGVSAGGLNASFLAQAPMPGGCGSQQSHDSLVAQVIALEAIWRTIESPSDIYKGDPEPSFVTLAEVAFGKDSLLDATPIRRLIDQHISTAKVKASGRGLHIGATSLQSGEYVGFEIGTAKNTPNIDLPRAVKASAAVPAEFTPVRYGDDLLVDGAIRNNTPLSKAFEQKPTDEIVVIQTSPVGGHALYEDFDMAHGGFLGGGKSALDVLARSARIMSEEIQKDDVHGAVEWSKAMKLLEKLANDLGLPPGSPARADIAALGKVATPIRVYAPAKALLRNELVFKKVNMDQMYDEGVEAALAPVNP